jgi:shikimate dehydrogenase
VVLGYPVHHSLSPLIHNAALRHDGLDYVYVALEVEPAAFPAALEGLRAMRVRGANITIPHKQQAATLVDRLDPLAARVGAVNTVVNEGGFLVGLNTAVAGFRAALRTIVAEGAKGRCCLVAGAGGAARAVVAALIEDQAAEIAVFNRTYERAVALCEEAGEWGGSKCEAVDEHTLAKIGPDADIVFNATSVGRDPAVKGEPFPVDIVRARPVVMVRVYGPEPTGLVRRARTRGAAAVDGLEMLLMQAADSYALWTGRRPCVDVMRAALMQAGE